MSELLSDNLLLFAWNLTCLLLFSIGVLFILICWKHWQRWQRNRATAEINTLLRRMPDRELFRNPNTDFHDRLKYYEKTDYLDLVYAWVRYAQHLSIEDRIIYSQNSARCGLFDQIKINLESGSPARICVSLEVCGLADLRMYLGLVEKYSWRPAYAPFACHALARIDFDEGMCALFRAYGHKLVNNSELLIICTEFEKQQILEWAGQTLHLPLPDVLSNYWVAQ